MIRHAVIFDLDGTLVDSLADLGESMNAVLERLSLPIHPIAAYRRFVGDGIRNLVLRALPDGARDEATITRGTALLRSVYGSRWDLKTRPYEGIPTALEALRARGVRLAVLTNKPHPVSVKIVERFFPSGVFDAVLGAERGYPRKPDPGGALALASRLGATVQECAYVGDTATDMKTAVAAGMWPIGCLWGFRDADELLGAGARALAEFPHELVAMVVGDAGV